MKCRKCGAQMGDDMLYCPVCGTHIPTSADEISDDDVALYIKEEKLEENRRIKRNRKKRYPIMKKAMGLRIITAIKRICRRKTQIPYSSSLFRCL